MFEPIHLAVFELPVLFIYFIWILMVGSNLFWVCWQICYLVEHWPLPQLVQIKSLISSPALQQNILPVPVPFPPYPRFQCDAERKSNYPKWTPNRRFEGFSLLKWKTHGTGTRVQHQGVERGKKRRKQMIAAFFYPEVTHQPGSDSQRPLAERGFTSPKDLTDLPVLTSFSTTCCIPTPAFNRHTYWAAMSGS